MDSVGSIAHKHSSERRLLLGQHHSERSGHCIAHARKPAKPACGASLDYMLDVFPLTDVLRKVLTGSGECAKLQWSLMGVSMPGWVLLWAVGLGGAGAGASWPLRRR